MNRTHQGFVEMGQIKDVFLLRVTTSLATLQLAHPKVGELLKEAFVLPINKILPLFSTWMCHVQVDNIRRMRRFFVEYAKIETMQEDLNKTNERIKKLREVINYHRELYHVYDKQEISDEALDSLKYELSQLESKYPQFITPDSPTQRVAGRPLEGL